ncbi:9005_t:CDS:2 [Paraglomus occultum]|uniref:9005_t:CDS:1 n=1 Tax=Paraglomus occultum TaxID=144539 RepID=A0A9N9A3G0_9GLOM|nr:9005_t:CDS:2 [Paraglomus occultum]
MGPMDIIYGCISIVKSILGALFYILVSPLTITQNASTRAAPQNPRATAEKFKREFEEKHGQRHPDFFAGGYLQALDQAKRNFQFLVVILQSDEHYDTEKFNSETLTSPLLIDFFRENNFIVWGGNVRESEAYQVSHKLRATTYPFVATIVYQQIPGTGRMDMVLSDKLEGLSTAENLLVNLTNSLQRHTPLLARLRAERESHEATRALREAQDNAYYASLRADQEKDRRARKAEEAKRIAEEKKLKETERKEREYKEKKEKREQWRRWAVESLPEEPGDGEKAVARLSFKFPDGKRVVRRFRNSESLETIYTFVDTYGLQRFSSPSKPPDNYTHKYKFVLVSPFPRTVYPMDKTKIIGDDKVLCPSCNLIIEEVESDDEGDELW